MAIFVPELGKMGKGWRMVKKINKMKVLRMKLPIVEYAPTPRESIFKLPRGSQRPPGAKNQTFDDLLIELFSNILFY